MHGFILEFFEAILAKNREKLPLYFKEDATILWTNTNECFTLEEYIEINCNYPGEWKGKITRIEKIDGGYMYVAHITCDNPTLSYHVISFLKIDDYKVVKMEEYYSEDGETPQWRKELHMGSSIQ